MSYQARVTGGNLNLRLAGDKEAAIVASVKDGALAAVDGAPNAAGYARLEVFGWLDKDGQTLRCDSLGVGPASIDAVVLVPSAFQAAGAPDVYGRQPGVVIGWGHVDYLTALERAP